MKNHSSSDFLSHSHPTDLPLLPDSSFIFSRCAFCLFVFYKKKKKKSFFVCFFHLKKKGHISSLSEDISDQREPSSNFFFLWRSGSPRFFSPHMWASPLRTSVRQTAGEAGRQWGKQTQGGNSHLIAAFKIKHTDRESFSKIKPNLSCPWCALSFRRV